MDRLKALVQSNLLQSEKDDAIRNTLDEAFIRGMTEEDYFTLVRHCLCTTAGLSGQQSDEKDLLATVMAKLQKCRTTEFNDISLLVISELMTVEKNSCPQEILAIVKELIAIDYLEDVVSTEFSEIVIPVLQALNSKLNLSSLLDIANLCQEKPKCLPPSHQHLKFCSMIINQITSLSIPSQMHFFSFMQDVIVVANMVQKIWLMSPEDVVLPCLLNIYTLIASSSKYIFYSMCYLVRTSVIFPLLFLFPGVENPPSCTLAAFLNAAPSSLIEIALDRLLKFPGVRGDDHVIKLAASVFCDWLWIWPKAPKVAHWLTSLFKMLTTTNRSDVVAEVIASKAPKVGLINLIFQHLKFVVQLNSHISDVQSVCCSYYSEFDGSCIVVHAADTP